MKSVMRVAMVVAAAGCAFPALAEDVGQVTIFGKTYDVQRFDTAEIVVPDLKTPGRTLNMIEPEGAIYAGNNKIFLETRKGNDPLFGAPASFPWYAIEINLDTNGSGVVTGISFSRNILCLDASIPNVPSAGPGGAANAQFNGSRGFTLNTSNTGIGAGGNIVMARSGNTANPIIAGFNSSGANPAGTNILPGWASISPNSNCEDIAFNPQLNEFWTVWQPGNAIVRVTSTGSPVSPNIAINASRDNTLVGNAAKGITYMGPSQLWPTGLQNGVMLVAMDDLQPGLEAYDAQTGAFIARQPLTDTDNAATGNSLLPLDVVNFGQVQLESLTADPATGRLFLVNQGAAFDGNYLYILNPVSTGPVCNDLDFNNDGNIEPGDVDAYFSVLGEGPCLGGSSCDSLDFNNDGNIEPEDVDAYFSVLGEGPCVNN